MWPIFGGLKSHFLVAAAEATSVKKTSYVEDVPKVGINQFFETIHKNHSDATFILLSQYGLYL